MKNGFNPKIVAAFDKCYQIHFLFAINDKWNNYALLLFKSFYFILFYFLGPDIWVAVQYNDDKRLVF